MRYSRNCTIVNHLPRLAWSLLVAGATAVALAPAWSGSSGAAEPPGPATRAGVRIPIDIEEYIAFGPPGTPSAIVGARAYDLTTGVASQPFADPTKGEGARAISADGHYLAIASKTRYRKGAAVAVWDVMTRRQLFEVPGDASRSVEFLAFAGGDHLLVAGQAHRAVDVWALTTGQKSRSVIVPADDLRPGRMAVAPDGKSFVANTFEGVVLFDVATGNAIGQMAWPEVVPIRRPAGLPQEQEAGLTFQAIDGLAFSPDGTRLAAFTTYPAPRLLVWNVANRAVTTDRLLHTPRVISRTAALSWLPDGRNLLVHGALYGCAPDRLLAYFRIPFIRDIPPHALDNDRVVGVFGDDTGSLRTVRLPWAALKASLAHMESKPPAHLAPGQEVSVEVDLDGFQEARDAFRAAMVARLKADSIPVAPGRPTRLRAYIPTDPGPLHPVYDRQLSQRPVGDKRQPPRYLPKRALALELLAEGEDRPLWRTYLTSPSGVELQAGLADPANQKMIIRSFVARIGQLDMPYFIPKSADHLALPAVIE